MHMFIIKYENYFTFRTPENTGSQPFDNESDFKVQLDYIKKTYGATSTEVHSA